MNPINCAYAIPVPDGIRPSGAIREWVFFDHQEQVDPALFVRHAVVTIGLGETAAAYVVSRIAKGVDPVLYLSPLLTAKMVRIRAKELAVIRPLMITHVGDPKRLVKPIPEAIYQVPIGGMVVTMNGLDGRWYRKDSVTALSRGLIQTAILPWVAKVILRWAPWQPPTEPAQG
jgi:hypothetical protein